MSNRVTLLELVTRIAARLDDDEEIVALAAWLVNSGTVRLCGNFAGRCFDLAALGLAGGFHAPAVSRDRASASPRR
jgi:hypothetical protein